MATRNVIDVHKTSFLRFSLVGGAATILNYSVFFILFDFLNVHYLAASGTGYVAGVILGFYFNKTYTFESPSTKYFSEGTLYLLVYAASLVAGLGLLRGFVGVGVPILAANVLVIGFTTVTNYLGSKYVVFVPGDLLTTVDYYRYRYRHLLTYVVIGVGSLVLEVFVIYGLGYVSPYQWLNIPMGFVVGMVFSFLLNVWYNFDVSENKNARTFKVFVAVSTLAFVLNLMLIAYLFNPFAREFYPLAQEYGITRFLSAGCVFLLSYTLHTWYTFDTKRVGIAVYLSESEDVGAIESKVKTRPDYVHLDLVDETYNETAAPVDLSVIDEVAEIYPDTSRFLHIMSEEPMKWMAAVHEDVDALIFHPEGSVEELIAFSREKGCKPGLCIPYDANVDSFLQYIDDVDIVQVLGIEQPGVSGQGMASESLETVEQLQELKRSGFDFEICFDGGVKRSNVGKIDADYVVSASAVLKAQNPKRALYDLKTNSRYYSNVSQDFSRHLEKGIAAAIGSLDFVESGTIVGSFLGEERLSRISDVDVVVIVDELTEDKYDAVVGKFQKLSEQIEVDYDREVALNTTFGPLKFDADNDVVVHLMVYDEDRHVEHCRRSPFTCLAWETSERFFKRPMTDIATVPTLQPNHFFDKRRSISDYLDDLNGDTVSYREYVFDDGEPRIVRREKEMTDKDRFEFSYHIMKFSMVNFLKLYYKRNEHYDLAETMDRYFSIMPARAAEHADHLLALRRMKLENDFQEWNEGHEEAVRTFLEDFETQFREYFEDATTVFFLRHAETAENDGETFLGQRRDPDVRGSVDVPDELETVDRIYTSPLSRSYQTASTVKARLGLSELVVDDRLVEIDYGAADGMTVEELQREHPEIVEKWSEGEDPPFPNGENTRDVRERIEHFLEGVEYGDEDAAVVTHNVVLRCLLGSEYDVPPSQWHEITVPHAEPLELLVAANGHRYLNLTEEQVETCFKDIDFKEIA